MARCSINLETGADNHNNVLPVVTALKKKNPNITEQQILSRLDKEGLKEDYLNETVGYISRTVPIGGDSDSKYSSIRVHRVESRDDKWEVLYTTDKTKKAKVVVIDKLSGRSLTGNATYNPDSVSRVYVDQQVREEAKYTELFEEIENSLRNDGATENEGTLLGASAKDKKDFRKNKKKGFSEKPGLLHDVDAMMDFARELNDTAANKADAEHATELLEELRLVMTGDGKFIPKDLRFFVKNTMEKTSVVFKPSADKDLAAGIHLTKGKKKGKGNNYQSDLEKLVHDVEHAATYYALHSKSPEVSGIRRRLVRVYEQVLANVTVDKLVLESASAADKKNAADLIDYLHGARGLDEFIALVRTNKMLSNYVKTETMKYKNENASTIWELVQNILKDILAVLGAIVGKKIGDQNAFDIVFNLSDELMKLNNRTEEDVRRNKLMNSFSKIWQDGDRALANVIESAATKAIGDTSFIEPLRKDATKLEAIVYTVTGLVKLLGDDRTRPYMYTALDKISPYVGYDSIFQKVVKTVTSKDTLESTVENLILESRKIDQQMERVHLHTTAGVHNLFKGKLTENDSVMMTEEVLETDLQALKNDYDVVELLGSAGKVDSEIDKLEQKLKSGSDSKYYIAQAKMLAHYMRTGNGNERLNTNASAIAKKFGTDSVNLTVDKKIIENIDKLVSLYALKNVPSAAKQRLLEMNEENPGAITGLLDIHAGFVQGSIETRFKDNPDSMIKGYVKELNDQNVDIEIAPESSRTEMEHKGYTLVAPVLESDMNLLIEPLAIYKREGFGLNNFTRYAFRTTRNHRKGTTIEDILYDNTDLNRSLVEARQRQVVALIQKKSNKKLKAMQTNGTVDTNYTNILPVYDKYGKIKTYRSVMGKDVKKELLSPDKRLGLVLGEMMAGHVNHVETIGMNRKVADVLVNDAVDNVKKENLSAGSIYGVNGYEYIEIGPEIEGTHKDKWLMLPDDVRYHLTKQWGKKGKKVGAKGVPVRKDLLKMYFGQRDLSIVDTKVVKMLPHKIQYYVKQVENLWIMVAKIAKVHMIIKTPAVWIGNIFSNIVLLLRQGYNIKDVMELHYKALEDLEEYQKIAKEIIVLEQSLMVEKSKKGNSDKIKRIGQLIAAKKGVLESNSAAPLIEGGLFSSIVEDVSPGEMKIESKIEKKIGKAFNSVPNWLSVAARYSLMTEDTKLYRGFLKVTQLGDFMGRYVHYHLALKKMQEDYFEKYGVRPNKQVETRMELAARNGSRDMFVNYNNPDNDLLQYLNRIMVVGFTKFFFGIQRVNLQLLKDKPLTSIADMFMQHNILDYEDITEHTYLSKNYGALLYSPSEVVDQALSLMGINLVTGNAIDGFDGLVKVKAI